MVLKPPVTPPRYRLFLLQPLAKTAEILLSCPYFTAYTASSKKVVYLDKLLPFNLINSITALFAKHITSEPGRILFANTLPLLILSRRSIDVFLMIGIYSLLSGLNL